MTEEAEDKKQPGNRKKTRCVHGPSEYLVLSLVLLAGYLIADRWTPVSTQARVHTLVVPIAAEVSGTVAEVTVANNQLVQAGEVLFRVEDERYRLAVASAEANLESARQATGASIAGVDAAEASVVSARANLTRTQQDAVRLRRIKNQDPGAHFGPQDRIR